MKPLRCLCLVVIVLAAADWARAVEPVGRIDWVRHCGFLYRDASQDMCGADDGSFYVTGWFERAYGYTGPVLVTPPNFGLRDIFLSKYDSDGELLWVRSAGSGHCDVSGAVDALSDGTCVLTGGYGYGTASCTFGHGQPNRTVLSGIGRYDVCIAKYDGDGILQWAKRAGGPEPDFGEDIALAPDGSVYVSGIFGPSITFGHGLPNQTTLTNPVPDSYAYFLARYDTDGVFQWAQMVEAYKIIALTDGTCILAGYNTVWRLSADGTQLWSRGEMYSSSLGAAADNEFIAAHYLLSGGMRVIRMAAQPDGSVSEVWSRDFVEGNPYYLSPISVRPDGAFTFCAIDGLHTLSADGSSEQTGYLGQYPQAIFALPNSGYCYFSGSFYEDITVGATTLTHLGEGDFYIARATTMERCRVTARVEGKGWIQFNSADGRYWKGETATLEAVPIFPGVYEFAEWGGDWAGLTDTTLTFPVAGDAEAVAVFEHVEGAPDLPAATAAGLAALAAALAAAMVRKRRL